jgi:integrase
MKANEIQGNISPPPFHLSAPKVSHRGGTYHKVTDARKRPIRGLWKRNNRYYARIADENPKTGKKQTKRIPLDAATTAQAQAELRILLTKRDTNSLPVLNKTPKFKDYVKDYLQFHDTVKDAKGRKTLDTEKVHLRYWVRYLGDVRLNKITRTMINGYIAQRQAEGVTGRTVNLGLTILRNVLNRAIDEQLITSLPTENLRPLKWTPKKRRLFSLEEIEKLCGSALEISKNGRQIADFIRLLAFCGGRMAESLRLKWEDVDWDNQQLTIGADGMSKNRKSRFVDFNPNLEDHLTDMLSRKAPDSDWIFPSPQRGVKDIRAKSFRESLILARNHCGLPEFGFHDARHFFVSYCVMSCIDFMTIAAWVGHSDGGILIGRVYGHLASEHRKSQARKIKFQTPQSD